MTAAIQISAVHKRYGSHVAVHDLDVTVAQGCVFGLIGPNGAGKTTTLRMLVDIIRPTSGDIAVLGQSPRAGGAALRRRIGYIPGELRVGSRLSGAAMLKHLAEISGPVPRGSIDELAERLGLDLTRPARTLSKGNKQKLGLVQAFMHRPELLILDEPTSGLDPLMQREFLSMVREARDAGHTVLLSSHVISEIQQTADQVAVLSQGKVVAAGPVATLQIASIRRVHATVSGLSAASLHAALTECGGIANLEVTDVDTEADSVVRMSATVQGAIDPVIRILGRGSIRDLTVEEPDLQESVLDLYLRGKPAPPEGRA